MFEFIAKEDTFVHLCYSNFAFNFTEIFSKILQTFILQTLESIIKIEIDENTEKGSGSGVVVTAVDVPHHSKYI